MQNKHEFIEQYKIAEMITGSRCYGTSTPSSDFDYNGIYVDPMYTPLEYYTGSYQLESEISLSVTAKDSSGKNLPEAIDKKFFCIKIGRAHV